MKFRSSWRVKLYESSSERFSMYFLIINGFLPIHSVPYAFSNMLVAFS